VRRLPALKARVDRVFADPAFAGSFAGSFAC